MTGDHTRVIHPTVLLGHTGFVGRAVHAHLAEARVPVYGFSSHTLDLRQPDNFGCLDDVLTPDATLIVASALTPDRGGSLATLADNMAMLVNVARYVETHPIRKCVFLSSDAVYPMVEHPVDESTPVELSSLYALAKHHGERMLQIVADTRGFDLLVLRPTGVYGPGDTHNSYGPNRFVRSIVRDRSVRLFGEGEETRDHIYIDDVARIIVELSASDARGIYNLATGTSSSFRSIVELLAELAPFEFEIATAPRSSAVTHRVFDTARLAAALPHFRPTPLEEGLSAALGAAAAVPA